MIRRMDAPASAADLARLRHRAVVLCIFTTTIVATVEIGIGLFFSLISVTAEGIHTAADLADSLVAFVLVRLATRPADGTHPYGHGKFDSLAALIEGAAVVLSGGWAIFKAAGVLLGVAAAVPRPAPITLACMAAAAVLYFIISRRVMAIARVTHSPAVFAEAMHLRTHIFITAGLLAGLAVSNLGQRAGFAFADRIDAVAALILGTYLVTVGARIILPAYHQLMDHALPPEELKKIAACLDELREEYVEIHGIRSRRSGTDRHVDIHLVVEAETSVRDAHELSHRIADRLAERMPGTRLLVHVEPADGLVLADYTRRNRVGAVYLSTSDPDEREAAHGQTH